MSICKNNVSRNLEDSENRIKLTGITQEVTTSLGTSCLDLLIGNQQIRESFNIVDSNFPINTDGIIGRDLMVSFRCKIDYETFTITFNVNDEEIVLPMDTKKYDHSEVNISARTEMIVPVNINVDEDSIVLNTEIQKGVFIANTIIPVKGVQHIKFLNTTDEDVVIKHFNVKTEPLENYNIFRGEKQTYNETRYKKILELINKDNLDQPAMISLLGIIREYQDVFHLEGAKLSTNNFYKQRLRTIDNNPVYIKNYRLIKQKHYTAN